MWYEYDVDGETYAVNLDHAMALAPVAAGVEVKCRDGKLFVVPDVSIADMLDEVYG